MAIEYDVYPTPSSSSKGEEDEKSYHVRLVKKRSVTTKNLSEQIEFGTSMTRADVESVLTSLSYLLANRLADGCRIHIDGIGYFQLAITAPAIKDPAKVRGEHISLKGINFQPDKKLIKQLGILKFRRSKSGQHSEKLSDDEVVSLLADYFQDHSFITRLDFQFSCGFTKAMALRRINALMDRKKLAMSGSGHSPVYVKGELWEE